MPPIDPPRIDREKVLETEQIKRQLRALSPAILEMLDQGEHLDVPFRKDDQIVIPIVRDADTLREADAASVHALVTAWTDEDV